MTKNYNELFIPINFADIAKETGVRKGNIFYSPTFNSWVVSGSEDVDLICIGAPFKEGDFAKGLVGEFEKFNGRLINSVSIKSNNWVVKFK